MSISTNDCDGVEDKIVWVGFCWRKVAWATAIRSILTFTMPVSATVAQCVDPVAYVCECLAAIGVLSTRSASTSSPNFIAAVVTASL